MKTTQKQLIWLGDSLEQLKKFSESARRSAGHQLSLIQLGLDPSDWKPMESVGAGVREVRIRSEKAYRVLYVAKFSEAVYVLHAFDKKSQKTNKSDIDLSSDRYKALVKKRSGK